MDEFSVIVSKFKPLLSLQIPVTYYFSIGIIICCLLGISRNASAQETDTSSVKIEDEQRTYELNQNFDRSMSGGTMTDMGTYSVPYKTQYYQAPFEGQKSLDRAVEAYRKEMKEKMGGNWYWQFLKAVSPYIRLHLGVNDFDMFVPVERDNPLFKSYNNEEKRQ